MNNLKTQHCTVTSCPCPDCKNFSFSVCHDSDRLIEELGLSIRIENSLLRAGMETIGDVLNVFGRSPNDMLTLRNFGEKSLDELVRALRKHANED